MLSDNFFSTLHTEADKALELLSKSNAITSGNDLYFSNTNFISILLVERLLVSLITFALLFF